MVEGINGKSDKLMGNWTIWTSASLSGGNALQYLPGASLFVSHQPDERPAIGFGMYGIFGRALDYGDNWAGRYLTQEAAVIGLSLQPTWAYKFTDDLSIGIGPRIIVGYYRTEMAINNSLLSLADLPDGQLEYKNTDVDAGANLGLLYQLDARTLSGRYDNSALHIIGGGATWRF